jgi:hypothetical protein
MKRALMSGFAAAAIAVGGLVPLATPASAASVTFSFGAPTRSAQQYHMGRQAYQVCRTKYRVSWWGGKPHRVPVGTDCHWEYPKQPTLTFRFGDQNNGAKFKFQQNQPYQYRPY